MTDPRRGELWLVDLGEPVGHEQAGRRPVLILSNDVQNNSQSGIVIVVPTTTTRRMIPSHIEIERGRSGLDRTSYATCEHVKSVSEGRLIHRYGSVEPDTMFSVGQAIRILLDI